MRIAACVSILALIGWSNASILRAAEPEIVVNVNTDEIYEGESVHYSVLLNHIENPTAPELAGFDDFTVTSLGETSMNSQSITIINGRRSENIQRGRRYDYRLTPHKTGSVTIPAPITKVGNQVLKGRTIDIRVVPPSDQETVFLTISCDEKSVYPMQPFTVTLTVSIRGLPAPHSDRNPLGIQPNPPELAIPWVYETQAPDGLVPASDWKEWLGPLQTRSGGFRINQIEGGSLFSIHFEPKPQRVRRKTKDGTEAGYWNFAFSREFTATKAGAYEFGPVTLKGTFATELAASNRLRGESIYAVAKSLKVVVKPVPEENRPETYIGAVGQFEFASDISPRKSHVGDPMTLTLTLKGKGTLDETFPPDLTRMPEVSERFKIYEATSETLGRSRRFTYSLRPTRDGDEPFPAIPISYFDVEHERYQTIRSAPIPIEIGEAEHLSDQDIVATGQAGSTGENSLEARNEGVFANINSMSAVRNEAVYPGRWLAGWLGMLGAYLITSLVIGQVRQRSSDPAAVRRRGAAGRARTALRAAHQESSQQKPRDIADRVRGALTGLIADATDSPEAGMTSRDAQERLCEAGVDPVLAERACGLLQRCDDARYGSAGAKPVSLIEDAEPLVRDLIKALKSRKLLS